MNRRINSRTRTAVAASAQGAPLLSTFLDRIKAIGEPALDAAIDGFWCGRDGRVTLDMEGTNGMLVVGWTNRRVEFAYVS